ncbi:hypothetical protein, partial [Mesorhizobium australafricanum]
YLAEYIQKHHRDLLLSEGSSESIFAQRTRVQFYSCAIPLPRKGGDWQFWRSAILPTLEIGETG